VTTRRLPPGKYRVRFLHVSDVPPDSIGWHFEVCGGPHDGRGLHLLTGYESPPGSRLYGLLCALARRTLRVGQAVDTTAFAGHVYSLRLLLPRRDETKPNQGHRDRQRHFATGAPHGPA
jgi:hypothetical protein